MSSQIFAFKSLRVDAVQILIVFLLYFSPVLREDGTVSSNSTEGSLAAEL